MTAPVFRRIWDVECVGEDGDGWRGAGEDDFDDIEAEGGFRIAEEVQPRECAARDEALLTAVDGGGGTAEAGGGAGLHFDEDEGVAVAADEIDLSPVFCAEVAVEDLVPVLAEMFGGEVFAMAAEVARAGAMRRAARRTRKSSGVPGEKCGDGLGRVHATPIVGGGGRCRSLCGVRIRSRGGGGPFRP